MAKRFTLVFMVRGLADHLVFEVRQDDSDRLHRILRSADSRREPGFFHFETVNGRSVVVNMAFVQAVRFTWEASRLPVDETRDEGEIELHFQGRADPLVTYTDDPATLWDFFTALETYPFGEPFPEFEDEDGEHVQVNPREVIMVSAPTHILDAGREIE